MHIFQNTDLKNVVLVVGIMAVDFDCAWGAFTQLQWMRVAKNVFWRRLWGAATCSLHPGVHVVHMFDLANMDTKAETLNNEPKAKASTPLWKPARI